MGCDEISFIECVDMVGTCMFYIARLYLIQLN